ncbi:stress responsive A/B barrel domain-containing protein [Coniochaeta ligniaria NRRL 30616]|uniref:Stress responsive A/B barrel domain-containing protein n=1 Tax=Coniochaeta ligniaria NRRL 30616 TaxID=1408157 RepID=A0A1J7IBG9_9PEZI|nr:stress responsive A/B barrel domain-containing protein [Coniochaeta ligniaria NRRL 30616]
MGRFINRITLFKISQEEDQRKLLDIYEGMQQKALKDGKPYILGVQAGITFPDQRSQGYTIAVQSTFASKEDMAYYDNGCAAHAELKNFAKTVHQGVMMVYFENALE